jgi:hypothetical protein
MTRVRIVNVDCIDALVRTTMDRYTTSHAEEMEVPLVAALARLAMILRILFRFADR